MEEIVQKQQYITQKNIQRKGGRKKKNTREKKRGKGRRNTIVKRKSFSLLIILTGHVR